MLVLHSGRGIQKSEAHSQLEIGLGSLLLGVVSCPDGQGISYRLFYEDSEGVLADICRRGNKPIEFNNVGRLIATATEMVPGLLTLPFPVKRQENAIEHGQLPDNRDLLFNLSDHTHENSRLTI